jgi:hypothetical protein
MNRFVSYVGAAVVAGASLLMSAPASADLCVSTTNCTLTFTQGNSSSGFGTGNFGTVNLSLNTATHIVTVTVSVAPSLLINTGFPGTIGFADSLGGGLTIGNFSNAAYSGSLSDATNDLHFDGFGFVNDAAGTTGPSAGSPSAVSLLSFTVSKGNSIIDVEQLLAGSNPFGGDFAGPVYFIADIFRNGATGLIGVTGSTASTAVTATVPEPGSALLLGVALVMLGVMRRRQQQH